MSFLLIGKKHSIERGSHFFFVEGFAGGGVASFEGLAPLGESPLQGFINSHNVTFGGSLLSEVYGNQWNVDYSGALAVQRAAKRSPIVITGKKRKPMKDFLMVIIASVIARGRVRTTTTTTTTESRNMAAILQKIGWQTHTALVYRVLLWY